MQQLTPGSRQATLAPLCAASVALRAQGCRSPCCFLAGLLLPLLLLLPCCFLADYPLCFRCCFCCCFRSPCCCLTGQPHCVRICFRCCFRSPCCWLLPHWAAQRERGVTEDTDLTAQDLRTLVDRYKKVRGAGVRVRPHRGAPMGHARSCWWATTPAGVPCHMGHARSCWWGTAPAGVPGQAFVRVFTFSSLFFLLFYFFL